MRGYGIGLLAVGWVLATVVFAFGPEDALSVRPAGFEEVRTRLELARFQESTALWGASTWVQLDRVRDWKYRAGVELGIDPVRQAQARLNRAQSQRYLRKRARDAVYRALDLHARTWQAQVDLEAARIALRIAKLHLEALKYHGAGTLELEDARLAVDDAEIALLAAENRLRAARAEAAFLGLAGEAEPRVLRFALPPPREDRVAELESAFQAAQRDRSWRGLFSLRAAAVYTGSGDFEYRFEVWTSEPRLGLSMAPKFPFSRPGDWRFTLSARIRLDPASWAQVRQADLALAEQRAVAARRSAERRLDLEYWRRQAELAEERLKLAEERFALAKKRAVRAQQRLQLGLIAPLDKERAFWDRLRAESRLAAAWAAYLKAVQGYLEAADGEWRQL